MSILELRRRVETAAARDKALAVDPEFFVVADGESSREPDRDASRAEASRVGAYQWADLMRRTFGVDVLACPHCSGRLRLVALIDQATVIQRILRHLGLPPDVPEPRPARAPPGHVDFADDPS